MKHPTKNISLNCPPGTFRGKFLGHAYQGMEGGQSEFRVRLLFEVMELSDQNTSILVARDFGLSDQPGSPLMNFLRNWLGPACTGKQLNTARFNLRRLKHRECELVVRHVYSPCQPEPIVHLLHVQPPTRRPNPAATDLLTTLPILRQTPTTATTPDPAKAAARRSSAGRRAVGFAGGGSYPGIPPVTVTDGSCHDTSTRSKLATLT